MVKIIIADDHPMVLNGLENMLNAHSDIEIIATYTNGKKLLEGLEVHKPDIILLDLMMPEMNGDEALAKINKKFPDIKVILLTNHGNAIYVNNMINMGAAGYLLKNVEEETLYNAIMEVIDGKQFIEPELLERSRQLNEGIKRTVALRHTLTNREKEVLQLIVEGNTSQEIAKQLFLSVSTIDTYRDNIILKLEAKNTADLVRIAIKLNLVNL